MGTDTAYGDRPVYLVDGARTPFLKVTGAPGAFTAADLAVAAARPLLARQPFDPEILDEVILGCVMPRADEANIARVVALRLGCGETMPAWTVQRNCGSGMQSLDSAARHIAAGKLDLILAGGTEAMSHAPVMLSEAMAGWLAAWNRTRGWWARGRRLAQLRPRHLRPEIALLKGLTDPIVGLSMGQTAEQLAYEFDIDRARMDGYALQSHQRLAAAYDAGRMNEVEPLFDTQGHVYTEDTGLRRDTDIEQLARLRPVFDRSFGAVTAGNSAQVTDGAAWLLLASESAVDRYQLPVLARLVDCQWAGLDPARMGLGPVHAMTPLLRRHGLALTDIDDWEINEAFAAQVLACLAVWENAEHCRTELGLDGALGRIDPERLNADGGAISIGHPVGASGARITLRLARRLRDRSRRRGIASLCIGGGQGGAMLLENVALSSLTSDQGGPDE